MILSHAPPCSCKSKEKEKEKKRNINNDLAVLPSHDIAHNILMHGKENAKSLWNYLHNKYGSPGPASVLQTISALDISRFLGIVTLLPRLQNSILFILGWRETNVMSPPLFMQ